MYNLSNLDLRDLFRIRDACDTLAQFDYHDKELQQEVNKELQERALKGE